MLKNLNNVSEALKEKCIPQDIKDGDVITFRLVGGSYDAEKKQYQFGSYWSYPMRDRIKDGGKVVPIGVYREFTNEKGDTTSVPEQLIVNSPGINEFNNGFFHFIKGSVEHDETLDWLFLTDHNESKPDRDHTKEPLFKYIDRKKEAKISKKAIDLLTAALMTATNLGAEEKRSFYAAMNWNLQLDEVELEAKLLQYAKDYPEDFLSRQNDKDARLKSVLKGALDKGIINYVVDKHAFAWGHNSVTIGKLDREEGLSTIDLMVKFLNEARNGSDTIKSITNKYNALLRDASAPQE